MTTTVYTLSRGIKTLKAGITLSQYRDKFPDAIEVHKPSLAELEEWNSECGCEAIDGCWVEPDGICEHGYNSWLLEFGYI